MNKITQAANMSTTCVKNLGPGTWDPGPVTTPRQSSARNAHANP